MTRTHIATAAPLVVMLVVAATIMAGCGVFDRAKDAVTSAPKPSPAETPIHAVAAPDPHLVDIPAVVGAKSSVVKIRAIAPSCQKVLEGSGFVLSPDRVMTTAHVVAGANSVTVEASGNPYDATVVSYDPRADIAILAVPNLPPPPLEFAQAEAKSGANAVVLGYPGGGNFTATPARIREAFKLTRRRLDGDQMRQRDAAVARLLAAHVPYRVIAARLDMSLGSVQKAVARIRAATPARERVVKVPRHRSRWGISSEQW
jgi:S1-C subfamily serine protease